MAIEPHIHEYALIATKNIESKFIEQAAFCKHPECDKELNALEIMDYLDWVEKYKDGLKQVGVDF